MKSKLPLDPDKLKYQTQRLVDKKPFEAYVLRVCDGDTIQVARDFTHDFFSGTEFIRLAAIDAPEMRGPDARLALWAQTALADLVIGHEVTVRPRRIWRDPYHRIIADVTFEGTDLATWLLHREHARVRKP